MRAAPRRSKGEAGRRQTEKRRIGRFEAGQVHAGAHIRAWVADYPLVHIQLSNLLNSSR